MQLRLFYFFVIGLFSFGCDGRPDEVSTASNVLSVYPNPCTHTAFYNVNNTSNGVYTLKAFDSEGNKMLEMNVPGQSQMSNALPMENKPAGTYYVILETGSTTLERQVVKQNR